MNEQNQEKEITLTDIARMLHERRKKPWYESTVFLKNISLMLGMAVTVIVLFGYVVKPYQNQDKRMKDMEHDIHQIMMAIWHNIPDAHLYIENPHLERGKNVFVDEAKVFNPFIEVLCLPEHYKIFKNENNCY